MSSKGVAIGHSLQTGADVFLIVDAEPTKNPKYKRILRTQIEGVKIPNTLNNGDSFTFWVKPIVYIGGNTYRQYTIHNYNRKSSLFITLKEDRPDRVGYYIDLKHVPKHKEK